MTSEASKKPYWEGVSLAQSPPTPTTSVEEAKAIVIQYGSHRVCCTLHPDGRLIVWRDQH